MLQCFISKKVLTSYVGSFSSLSFSLFVIVFRRCCLRPLSRFCVLFLPGEEFALETIKWLLSIGADPKVERSIRGRSFTPHEILLQYCGLHVHLKRIMINCSNEDLYKTFYAIHLSVSFCSKWESCYWFLAGELLNVYSCCKHDNANKQESDFDSLDNSRHIQFLLPLRGQTSLDWCLV